MYKKSFKQKVRESIAIILALLMHFIFIYALSFWNVYFFEDDPVKEYGMEVSYGDSWTGTDSESIPVETVSQEDLADIEPSNSKISDENSEDIANNNSDIRFPDRDDKKEQQETEDKDDESNKTKQNKDPKKDGTKEDNNEQGNNKDADGNQGKDTGTDGSDNIYTPGGSGASLEMTGWTWEESPTIRDESNETGKIIFEILVSNEGDILDVLTIESTVSQSLERIYKEKVYQIRFFKTDTNASSQPVNKGRITFIITAR